MIGAHEAIFPDLPVFKRSAAVGTFGADQAGIPLCVAEEDQIFTKHSHGDGKVFEVPREIDGMPVPTKHLSCYRSRSGARKLLEKL
jgi:hypothetical protein